MVERLQVSEGLYSNAICAGGSIVLQIKKLDYAKVVDTILYQKLLIALMKKDI